MSISTPNVYPISLTGKQRQRLDQITRNGDAPAKKIRHAQVLLLSDQKRVGGKYTRDEIAATLNMHVNTVDRIRKRFVLEGEAPAINRKPRLTPAITPKLDGRREAKLVAICCGPPPEGRVRWTMKLLAGELVKRRIVTYVCAETVRRSLKKTNCNPGVKNAGVSQSVIQHAL